MVLGILIVSAIPVTTGIAQGVSEQKKKDADASNERRMDKFHLDIYSDSPEINGMQLVMRDEKVYLAKPSNVGEEPGQAGHPFTGFYINYPHPDEDYPTTRGMVSTVSLDPPVLNWIYADIDTGRLRYGNRTASCEHIFGPWDWTPENGEEGGDGVMLNDREGFVAVEEKRGLWGVYFDRMDDELKSVKEVEGRKRLLCSLERRLLPDEQQARGK